MCETEQVLNFNLASVSHWRNRQFTNSYLFRTKRMARLSIVLAALQGEPRSVLCTHTVVQFPVNPVPGDLMYTPSSMDKWILK